MPALDMDAALRMREAEVAGMVTGALLAGETPSAAARFGAEFASSRDAALSEFAEATRRALRDDAFGFPTAFTDSAVALDQRIAVMAMWTRGYLSGLGQAGARLAALDADGLGLLRDCEALTQGAALASDDAAGDETAFAEILDYLGFTVEYFRRALA